MTKEEAFKKYLHLYVGSDAQITISNVTGKISVCTSNIVGTHGVHSMPFASVEILYLRPLSSMTDIEALEFMKLDDSSIKDAKIDDLGRFWFAQGDDWDYCREYLFKKLTPKQFTWLLNKGFCIDDTLFKEGHAKELA